MCPHFVFSQQLLCQWAERTTEARAPSEQALNLSQQEQDSDFSKE
jgi:hypothetical protein